MCVRERLHRRNWEIYAEENQGARKGYPTREDADLRFFRARPQHRTPPALERSKVYLS